MVFFNRLAKNSVSPPVKIIIKFEYFALYAAINPSISNAKPFTTPEWIDSVVEAPIKSCGLSTDNKGSRAVKLCKDS